MSEYHPLCMRCRSEAGRPRAGTTELCFEHLHKDRDAWKIEALAARPVVEFLHTLACEFPKVAVRIGGDVTLIQALDNLHDARAANEEGKKR